MRGFARWTVMLVVFVGAASAACTSDVEDAFEDARKEETGQSEDALRSHCSVPYLFAHSNDSLRDKIDIYYRLERGPGDKFACSARGKATLTAPDDCTREYTLTLYNGARTQIVKTTTNRGAFAFVQEPDVRIPRGSTHCRQFKFEDDFNNAIFRKQCFECPVHCEWPDDC